MDRPPAPDHGARLLGPVSAMPIWPPRAGYGSAGENAGSGGVA